MNTSFAAQRRELVQHLKRMEITDERVLDAMGRVPREFFTPERERRLAYQDHALPIECNQTISQPYTVALMCQALQLHGTERVLEIGTGSGYNAALLAELATEVISIERHPQLARTAERRLLSLGYGNVDVHTGDGTHGWPDAAPFDAIVVTAAAVELPNSYEHQLIEGGRILIPIGIPYKVQNMMRFTKCGGRLIEEDLGRFQFVPLVSGTSEADAELGLLQTHYRQDIG